MVFFTIVGFGSIYKFKLTNQSLWLYFFLWALLFMIAGFRADNVDNDYENYIVAIKGEEGFTEPSFSLISYICYDLLDSTKLVFVTYALLSISLLFYGLKKLSPYFFLSLAVYFSTSYVIHDLNAIRAGVGVGFTFIALDHWINERAKKTFLFLALATFFHISFSMFFVFYFFLKDNKKYLLTYILLIPISYLIYFLRIDALSLLMRVPIPQVQTLALAYSEWNTDVVSTVNVFSSFVLIKLLIFTTLVVCIKQLGVRFKGFYLYLKMYSLGFFLLIFLASLPGAAFRSSDLLWISECLLLPMLIVVVNPRWVTIVLILIFCIFMVWLNYVHSDFVRPYDFNFEL